MAHILADRVKETTATLGNGDITLDGPVVEFRSFLAGIGGDNSTDYCIICPDTDGWEVGLGVLDSSGTILTRDTVYISSAGTSRIVLAGTSTVFCTLTASTINSLITSANIIPWKVTPGDFDIIIGDGLSEADALANGEKMQAAWDYCATNGRSFLHVGGPIEVASELHTRSGLTVERSGSSSWLKPRWVPGLSTPWGGDKVGAFITNTFGASSALTVQTDVLFVDPWIDGELMSGADAYEIDTAQAGTSTTITLSAAASSVDDYYVGKIVQFLQGTGALTTGKIVIAYVGATRVATVGTAWAVNPDNTTLYGVGTNTNALAPASGMTNFRVLGGILKNFAMGVPGAGGKGISCQQGSAGTVVDGTIIENCFFGIMQQGWTGSNANGTLRGAIQDTFTNIVLRNCGTAISYWGTDPTEVGFEGSMVSMSAVYSNITAYECGHAPLKFSASALLSVHMKSGVFSFARGHNVSLRNLRAYNSETLVYPTDYTNRYGYGLTGPIGAVVWANGRSLDIDGLYAEGDYDALLNLGRLRSHGDDGHPTGLPSATPPVVAGWPFNNFDISIRNVKHRGTLGEVVHLGETLGYFPTDIHLSLDLQAEVKTVTTGLVDDRSKLYVNSHIDLTTRDEATSSYKRIIGTPNQIWFGGNDFADFAEGVTNLFVKPAVKVVTAAEYAISKFEDGTYFYNLGATGTQNFTLPLGTPSGMRFTFATFADGKTVTITAETGGVIKYQNNSYNSVKATDSHATVTLVAESSTNWGVESITGAWDILNNITYIAPLTGAVVTMPQSSKGRIIDPAGTIATLTVVLPATPVDGHIVTVKVTQQITLLTVNGSGTATVARAAGICPPDTTLTFIYNTAADKWY